MRPMRVRPAVAVAVSALAVRPAGWRLHQGALLERGDRHIAVAVMTRGSPTVGYGAATITGVTARLLRGYR